MPRSWFWAPAVGIAIYALSEACSELGLVKDATLAWWPALGPYTARVCLSALGFALVMALGGAGFADQEGKRSRLALGVVYAVLLALGLPPVLHTVVGH